MRKLCFVLLWFFLLPGATPQASTQINRRSIKRNNNRMTTYRGRKEVFGKEKGYNSIGFSVAAVNYYGDLVPKPTAVSTDISFTRPGFGLSFTHRYGSRYSLKVEFWYTTIKGSGRDYADLGYIENGTFRYLRNLSFRNCIKELSVIAVFDLFENQSTYISRVKWVPDAFMSLAAFHHNPQAQAANLNGAVLPEAGQWADLHLLDTEGQHFNLNLNDVNYKIRS